jgi:hypothetical protein
MSETIILRVLRTQAWQRAKGEMMSILETYYGELETFESAEYAIKDFIEKMEADADVA